MKKLVIAEKPEIAKAISEALPAKSIPHNGYIECGDWVITWCYGHMLTLKEPEDYGPEYARSNTDNDKLPIFFPNWETKIPEPDERGRSKKTQLELIGKLLKDADVVIHAGDIDEEGQLLVEEVLEWFKYKGPVQRVNTNALDLKSMQAALAQLSDNRIWHPLALAARARSVGDLMVGVNFSRFYSNIYHVPLAIGRVQTPTLGLVVRRDEQIENHIKQFYFLLDMDAQNIADGQAIQVRFFPAKDNPNLSGGRFLERGYLDKLAAGINGKEFPGAVTKEKVTEQAPLPFNINRLKIYCSDKFGISPEETLKITQELREKHKIITYNRSDCEYLPENLFSQSSAITDAVIKNLGERWNFAGLDTKRKSRAFSDTALKGYPHHAIIPTSQRIDISSLSSKELKVYKAICGYYFIQFMPPCEKERTRLTIQGTKGNKFEATSVHVLLKGFRAVMSNDGQQEAEKTTALSGYPSGDYRFRMKNPVISQKETKPPPRYTDATLEDDMTKIAKYVDDEKIRDILLKKDEGKKREFGSIGTAATRSAIIKGLKSKGYIRNDGKQLISTELGREFFRTLPPELQQPGLTAKWWLIQEDIKAGKATPDDLYNDIIRDFNVLKANPQPGNKNVSFLNIKHPTIGNCPLCKRPVIEGKLGFGCTGYKEGCKFTIWKTGKYGIGKVLSDNGKKITVKMAEKLLRGEKVLIRDLYSSAKNTTYSAYLVIGENGYLEFDFEDVPQKTKKKRKK